MEGISLSGWTFSEESIRRALAGEILLNPSLDLGNPCNLNCPYCFVEEKNSFRKARRKGELAWDEIASVVSNFLDAGAETINLVGAGEPTIDPQFCEVVEQVFKGNGRVVLFTNGTTLKNSEVVNFLWEHNVTVILKYNSNSASIQDAVVGKVGYTEERDRALQLLIDAGFNATKPTRLGIDTLAFEGNLEELPVIHKWCRERNIYPLTAEFIPAGRTGDGTVEAVVALDHIEASLAGTARSILRPLSDEQREWLRVSIEMVDQELGLWHFGPKAYFGGGVCTQLLGVYVDIEGRIWPCVARTSSKQRSREPLGWIRRGDRPSDIWRNSDYLEEIRRSYTGACPYKPSLEPINVSSAEARQASQPSQRCTSANARLVQIGHRPLVG